MLLIHNVRSLFLAERDRIQLWIHCVKKLMVAIWLSVSQKNRTLWYFDITRSKFFNLNKISEITYVQYSQINQNVTAWLFLSRKEWQFFEHLVLHYIIGYTDCIDNSMAQNKDMCIVRSKAKDFIRWLEWHDLLSSDSVHFLSRLAVTQRRRDWFWPMVNIEMPRAVGNCDKGQIWCTDAELSLLFRRLNIAKCVEGAHVPPADWRRSVGGFGNFWLPDKSVDIVSQAKGWRFVSRKHGVEEPLITTRVHLHFAHKLPYYSSSLSQ